MEGGERSPLSFLYQGSFIGLTSCQVEPKPASFWWCLSGSQRSSRAGGEPPLVSSDWLNSTLEVSDWSNEETKVGCLVILRKLMCYSFCASKDQEVCSLCVAEKFFTYSVGGGGVGVGTGVPLK